MSLKLILENKQTNFKIAAYFTMTFIIPLLLQIISQNVENLGMIGQLNSLRVDTKFLKGREYVQLCRMKMAPLVNKYY